MDNDPVLQQDYAGLADRALDLARESVALTPQLVAIALNRLADSIPRCIKLASGTERDRGVFDETISACSELLRAFAKGMEQGLPTPPPEQ